MNLSKNVLLLILATVCLSCSTISSKKDIPVISPPPQERQSTGTLMHASYYGKGDGLHGRKTASGETFNAHAFTAAHRKYPFGTILEITNPQNNKSVRVTVNDRGPFVKGRDIDLSYAAAKEIGIVGKGVKQVRVEVISSK